MKVKLTKRLIEGIEASDRRQVLFDEEFPGFALRVNKSKKTFYYGYRAGKGRAAPYQWVMLGSFPVMTVETARQKAKEKAALVQAGHDPAQEVRADKEAADMRLALKMFETDHISKLKPKTGKSYSELINNKILPALGRLRVKDVSFSNIAKLHHDMKDTPYSANRCLAVLSKFFSWAMLAGIKERGVNPCMGIAKYKEVPRKKFMGERELAVLGETLSRMEAAWHERQQAKRAALRRKKGERRAVISPRSAAVIRLLMLTGARVSEILSLEWDNIEMEKGVARLPDSKTGFKTLLLPPAAVTVLQNLPEIGRFVFPGDTPSGHAEHVKDAWYDVLEQARLDGWRLHDLRHAFASVMVNSGASLPLVGKVLGHTQAATTARYAHLEENPAYKAASEAGARIAAAMNTKSKRAIIHRLPKEVAGG